MPPPPSVKNIRKRARRAFAASARHNLFAWLEAALVLALIGMVFAAYWSFSSAPPNGQPLPSAQVTILLVGALLPALSLIILGGRRLALRRAAGSTARLHVRLVFLFSMIAAVPTLLFAAFAAILFKFGVDFFFSDASRGLMENANQLAEGYYANNQLDVGRETVAMAGDMRAYLARGSILDGGFPTYYGFQAQSRDLSESVILQETRDGTTRIAALLNLRDDNQPTRFVNTHLAAIKAGELVHVEGNSTRIEAVAPIDVRSGIYLYTSRNSEAESFAYWKKAESIAADYALLTNRARALQLRFVLALFTASLALVSFAVWFALRFADRQVQPLTELVAAARRVGAGNFSMRVQGRTTGDEIGLLNRAFNRMTAQLEKQTAALITANHQLDERRSFIEAVLESVSAGIVSVDRDGHILLMNASAQQVLFDRQGPVEAERILAEVAPEIASMVADEAGQGLVTLVRQDELVTLAVKVSEQNEGHVITFDDITRQLLDQRQAAWSDVARRIAHEIKNPLTPIQLATERLKRRYRKQIHIDGELFDELTSTVIRQVGDLRKMVDEFSSFARLPKPVFRNEDAVDLVRQAMFLQEIGRSDIAYRLTGDIDDTIWLMCDRHQFGQALTNVLKNAAEAIDAGRPSRDAAFQGSIEVALHDRGDYVTVAITDNGIGLPKDYERLVEPYVTTREKGTGLGLAIVSKIVEEHGGDLLFHPGAVEGSSVTLRFVKYPEASDRRAAE